MRKSKLEYLKDGLYKAADDLKSIATHIIALSGEVMGLEQNDEEEFERALTKVTDQFTDEMRRMRGETPDPEPEPVAEPVAEPDGVETEPEPSPDPMSDEQVVAEAMLGRHPTFTFAYGALRVKNFDRQKTMYLVRKAGYSVDSFVAGMEAPGLNLSTLRNQLYRPPNSGPDARYIQMFADALGVPLDDLRKTSKKKTTSPKPKAKPKAKAKVVLPDSRYPIIKDPRHLKGGRGKRLNRGQFEDDMSVETREASGMSIQILAERVGCSAATIRRMHKNSRGFIEVENPLRKIVDAMEIAYGLDKHTLRK